MFCLVHRRKIHCTYSRMISNMIIRIKAPADIYTPGSKFFLIDRTSFLKSFLSFAVRFDLSIAFISYNLAMSMLFLSDWADSIFAFAIAALAWGMKVNERTAITITKDNFFIFFIFFWIDNNAKGLYFNFYYLHYTFYKFRAIIDWVNKIGEIQVVFPIGVMHHFYYRCCDLFDKKGTFIIYQFTRGFNNANLYGSSWACVP